MLFTRRSNLNHYLNHSTTLIILLHSNTMNLLCKSYCVVHSYSITHRLHPPYYSYYYLLHYTTITLYYYCMMHYAIIIIIYYLLLQQVIIIITFFIIYNKWPLLSLSLAPGGGIERHGPLRFPRRQQDTRTRDS